MLSDYSLNNISALRAAGSRPGVGVLFSATEHLLRSAIERSFPFGLTIRYDLQKDKEDLEEVSTELELADEDELVP